MVEFCSFYRCDGEEFDEREARMADDARTSTAMSPLKSEPLATVKSHMDTTHVEARGTAPLSMRPWATRANSAREGSAVEWYMVIT